MKIGKYSFGVGDRFSHQGEAQLRALMKANAQGIEVTPVWNKSNREHNTIHSEPIETRQEADAAVKALGWTGQYCVDADHINLTNVDRFIDVAEFFTLDVAMYIGNPSPDEEVAAFIKSCKALGDKVVVDGIAEPIVITEDLLKEVAGKFLAAVKEAGKIYSHIESVKGKDNFITEVSMDEVESPQTPVDMFFILKMIADQGIPAQTFAPKFTGRFNKGVDYVGDTVQFAKEFEDDLMVIDYAVKHFGLPDSLKLSVHSGSDKFTIYPIMAEILKKHDKGLHIKTAGTTWLEEVIGLAIAGDDALVVAKEVYAKALGRKEELCAPYADVIDIDDSKLPTVEEVSGWSGEKFANTLRHIPGHPDYNPNFRQLIHVGYKVAAELGETYIGLLEKYADVVGGCVEENIYDRHLKRLFNL
ncbi:tagaturonate epimerase family protein [Mangrovibacterium diazotrophicum]|uniref:Tagaturonate/fructuronate epimerase n=1 Tax=Mangrovibacterium diazotrophicum TaxID=1261403 RepID=A0A419VZ62_9BACT|nr:tagaturonate epimerase family protein [Mangrovibacterium diazotrophicum]RKD88506.1 tagaturonate epimerase [Mangrovibacterium diazotrophicum]